MTIRHFYALMAVVGTVVPWFFFGLFISSNGIDLPGFVAALFATTPAGGFTSDLLLTTLVFWVWSYLDARERQVPNWWLAVPAVLFVGLSLALPLYLYQRAGADESPGSAATT